MIGWLLANPLLAAAGVATVGLAVALAAQTMRLADARTELARAQADHAQQVTAWQEAVARAEAHARHVEQQRAAEMEEIARDAQTRIDRARRDAAAADDVARKLRAHIALLVMPAPSGGAPARDPAAAPAGTPAAGPGLMLAQLFRGADDRASELARWADQAHAAGIACERAYDALRRTQ